MIIINKVILIGNITKDIELSYIAGSGMAVARFTLAVQRPFKKDETDFINCVAFNKLAENVANYTQKGSKVAVEGSIKTGSFDAKDGSKRYTTDINCNAVEFLSKTGNNDFSENTNNRENQFKNNAPKNEDDLGIFEIPIMDGDSPF